MARRPARSLAPSARIVGIALVVVARWVPGAHAQETSQASPEPAASPSPSPAPVPPETREELLRQRRLAKGEKLEPYRPSFLERQILAIEKAERPNILNINYKGFYPTIASISSGSRLAPGVRFWQPNIGGSHVSLHASAAWSLAGYELYDLQVGSLPHRGKQLPLRSTKGDDVYELADLDKPGSSHLVLYGFLRYRHNPQEAFFGLGPDSSLEDRTNYLAQGASYELVAGYQFGPHVVATLRPGYLQAFTTDGTDENYPTISEVFDDTTAPGLARQPDFYTLTSTLLVDLRDVPFNPHRGVMLALSYSRFDERDGTEFDFNRFALDARGYVPLGSAQRVLALRAFGYHDDPTGPGRVPFYLQQMLGTSHLLRGFERLRFRGEKLLSLQAEYRWEAAPAVELALFLDTGTVAAFGEDLDFDDMDTAYGFGLRFKSWESVLVRMDMGFSREGSRFYFRFSPSF